ncbi:hypothetical protein C2E23DRAFT_840714 [Lenzites betulinus]|nr:hypothetical protein C2E23DRAFT_840714 [Lenzites betulinus]
MELTIQQPMSNGQWQKTPFRMNIDTGSNTTWILGAGVCKAEYKTGDSVKGTTREIHLTKWPLNNPPPWHNTLSPNPFLHNPSDSGDIFRRPNLPTYLRYTDNSLVVVEQLAEPLMFTVDNLYSWNQSRWNVPPQTFAYRFAVAYAADESMMHENYDGILGLGPLRYQQRFHRSRAEQDFSTMLTRQCVPLKSDDTEVETYSGGYVYYFGLRPPPQIDIFTDPSWMAVNQWPCDKIEFSEKIPVREIKASAKPTSDPYRGWAIGLQSMGFFKIVVEPDDEGTLQRRRVLLGRLHFGNEGTLFALDTGASTSDLPADAHAQLKDIFGKQDSDQEEQAAGTIHDGVGLRIPPAYCNDETEIVVDFVFLGEKADARVTVTGPAKPFLCQDSKGECLLYGYPQSSASDLYVLGLNFFQAMFVAMHRPANPARDAPYIRLAPQWPQEKYRLRLPPKEGQARDPKGKQVEMDDELMDTDSELTDMEE